MAGPTHVENVPDNVVRATGPLLLGYLFNWGLMGVLIVQMYIYYLAFPDDRRTPKAVVYCVGFWEILQTILLTRDAFRVFGPGFGSPAALNEMAWIWFSVPIMSGSVACVVQCFFSWRIYVLSKRWYIPLLIVMISVVGLGASIWVGVVAKVIDHFTGLPAMLERQYATWLGSSALADTMICTSMIYYLSQSRTGFKATNTILTKFMRLTVETGMICAAVAIVELAVFIAFPNDSFYMCPARTLSKLYSNSLLALLNARFRIVGGRAGSNGPVSDDVTLSHLSFNNHGPSGNTTMRSLAQSPRRPNSVGDRKFLNIQVNQETFSDLSATGDEDPKYPRDLHASPPRRMDMLHRDRKDDNGDFNGY